MTKPKLIIHAGTPKTGTTTLQQSFYISQSQLIEKKILYPDLEIHSAFMPKHQWLVSCLVNGDFDRFDANIEKILTMAKEANATIIFLSSEGIFNHWKDLPAESKVKLKELCELFSSISIWCVFRKPISFITSLYSQVLKNFPMQKIPFYATSLTLEKLIDDSDFARRLNYMEFINEIKLIFGKNSLIATKYESEDILEQARKILGIDKNVLADVHRQNESLSKAGNELLRQSNKFKLKPSLRFKALTLIYSLDKILRKISNPIKPSKELIIKVKQLSAVSEEYLAKYYGITWK